MNQTDLVLRRKGFARPVTHTLAQRNGWSDAEVVLFVGAGLVVGAVAVGLRAYDVVVAWPELFGGRRGSSARRRQ